MAEKRCAAFYRWIYNSETVCLSLSKNPQIANLVFYLWKFFFHSSVFITTLATAKNLNMGPNEKEPVCHFFRWVLYNNKILHSSS